MKKSVILIIAILSVTACTKKSGASTGEKDMSTSGQAIMSNEVLSSNTNERKDNGSAMTVPQPLSSSGGESAAASVQSFFFSGRTNLLSLRSGKEIFPSGFSLGPLFTEGTAGPVELELVDKSIRFLKSIPKKIELDLVVPKARIEIDDYCRYFLKGKIETVDAVFAIPQISRDSASVKLMFSSENRNAFMYFEKTSETGWMISGFEVDLRENRKEETVEKWAPSYNPLPF